jgi:hydrogenase maturation protease
MPDKRKDKTARTVVIGVGNLLMKDEGAGIHAIQALQEAKLPPNVELIDGGTEPDLISFIRDGDRVIIIDCAKAGGEAGAIYQFKPEDLASDRAALASAHEMGVAENLHLMSVTGNQPSEVIIFGIEPAVIDYGLELSPILQASLPRLVEVVTKEINNG